MNKSKERSEQMKAKAKVASSRTTGELVISSKLACVLSITFPKSRRLIKGAENVMSILA